MEVPPPPVPGLGGNVCTTAAGLGGVTPADATVLRRLDPALAVAVASVPWADTTTRVRGIALWRAALPAATSLKLATKAPLRRGRTFAALEGVTVLDTTYCGNVTDDVIARLPSTLRALNVAECTQVTPHASFTHLPALEWLDCSSTCALAEGVTRLPPSLRELHLRECKVPDTADFSHLRHLQVMRTRWYVLSSNSAATLPPSLEVLDIGNEHKLWHQDLHGRSLAHLTRLSVLKASRNTIDDAAIAALPPSLNELELEGCNKFTFAASFAHLACLRTLNLCDTPISSATLATLPPSLVSLDLPVSRSIGMLTPSTVFPHLPALRVLNVSHTGIGDAAIASMPAGLEELSLVGCSNVTQHAGLDHLAALRVLQSAGSGLSRATIAACRARGCFAPADGNPVSKQCGWMVDVVVPLPDGRLVSGATLGRLALWKVTAGRGAVMVKLEPRDNYSHVYALAVLHDGHLVRALPSLCGTRAKRHTASVSSPAQP